MLGHACRGTSCWCARPPGTDPDGTPVLVAPSCPHGNAAASYCALCLRGRVAELEAELVVATVKGLELTKLLDPAVVWAATQLKVNADAHPGGCCVKCRAALAEVARLEALIVSWADCAPDVDRSLLDEADRIMGRE